MRILVALPMTDDEVNALCNAIIEECARVAEYANGEGGSFLWVGQQIAAAIRALKDKP